jgi:hypothetical protein
MLRSTEVVSVRCHLSLPLHADGPKNACDCDTSVTRGTTYSTTYSMTYSMTYSFTRHVTTTRCRCACLTRDATRGTKEKKMMHGFTIHSFILDDDDEG